MVIGVADRSIGGQSAILRMQKQGLARKAVKLLLHKGPVDAVPVADIVVTIVVRIAIGSRSIRTGPAHHRVCGSRIAKSATMIKIVNCSRSIHILEPWQILDLRDRGAS